MFISKSFNNRLLSSFFNSNHVCFNFFIFVVEGISRRISLVGFPYTSCKKIDKKNNAEHKKVTRLQTGQKRRKMQKNIQIFVVF